MKEKNEHVGFVKVFRQILASSVAKEADSVFAAFIKILLLVDRKTGVWETSVGELTESLNYGSKHTTYKTLANLIKCRVIKTEKGYRNIKIIVPNWYFFQQKNSVAGVQKVHATDKKQNAESAPQECTKCIPRVQKVHATCAKSARQNDPQHNSVRVNDKCKEVEEIKRKEERKYKKTNGLSAALCAAPNIDNGPNCTIAQDPAAQAAGTATALQSEFLTWWAKYPKKEAQAKAWAVWKKKRPDLQALLKALDWYIKSDRVKDGFAMQPAKYLQEERWKDDPAGYFNKGDKNGTDYDRQCEPGKYKNIGRKV